MTPPDAPEKPADARAEASRLCAVLFADGYVDADTACAALFDPRLSRFLSPRVRRAWATWRANAERRGETVVAFELDLLADILCCKIVPQRGLRAATGEIASPLAYLCTLVANAAVSELRDRVLPLASPETTERALADLPDEAANPERLASWAREGHRVREAALNPRTELRANLRLAFVAQAFPQDLTPALVDLAKAEGGGQPDQGLVRSAEETWDLLQRHLVQPGLVPAIDEAGRLAFAWIARGSGTAGPAAWRDEEPAAAARALDTVAEWLKRAGTKLLLQLPESVVHDWRSRPSRRKVKP